MTGAGRGAGAETGVGVGLGVGAGAGACTLDRTRGLEQYQKLGQEQRHQ